jgi:hypothetical protein
MNLRRLSREGVEFEIMKFKILKLLVRKLPMPEAARLWFRRRLLDRDDELDYQFLEEYESRYHSRQLLNRARKLRLPVPATFDGDKLTADYRRSGLDGHRYFLSPVGEQKVRLAIREEEKYRSEVWTKRIPYLTAITGLVGAITGLVALLSKLN